MMNHGTSFLKRFVALALALVLLASNANLGVSLTAFAAESTSGRPVSGEYRKLNEKHSGTV